MAVPGYQEFMLPLLRIAGDGKEHSLTEAVATLAGQMKISEEDRNALLPSGQTRVYNRVGWAVTYLSKSVLIKKTARGRFRIAPRGVDVLKENPSRIDIKYLTQFPEYQAFKIKKKEKLAAVVGTKEGEAGVEDPDITPDEQLDVAYKELRETLADELLHHVRAGTPKFFEHLVVDLLVAMGYGGSRVDAAQVVGKSGDGGIDGVIKEDRLGLDMVYLQAKRVESDIGPGAIREFVGSLGEHKANKGVFITCGGFTSGARDAAAKAHSRIVLIDGEQLAEFMIDHGVGVTDYKTYTVKKLDSDYFEDAWRCEGTDVRGAASSNPNAIVLDAFCGCSTALVAAQNLGRQWIGIDISPTACRVMAKRLRDVFKFREDEKLWFAGREEKGGSASQGFETPG